MDNRAKLLFFLSRKSSRYWYFIFSSTKVM